MKDQVSVVITQDGAVSVWVNLFDARRYATKVDGKLIEDVDVQPKGTKGIA